MGGGTVREHPDQLVVEAQRVEAIAESPPGAPSGGAAPRAESFDACVEDLRASMMSEGTSFVGIHLSDLFLRWCGIEPTRAARAAMAGLVWGGIPLIVPLIVTAIAGGWAEAPLWRWVVVAAALAIFGVGAALMSHPPRGRLFSEEVTVLVPMMMRESDVRLLLDFNRRWYRGRVAAVAGVGVALATLLACVKLAPDGLRELPAGSFAVLAIVLYGVGEVVFWNLWSWPFIVREGRFEHRLFWPSPVDSMAVQAELRCWASMAFMCGFSITFYLIAALVLVSLDSPLVLPVAAGLTATGYVTTLGSMVAVRRSIGRIVERTKERHLALLQRRIEPFDARLSELTPEESERVEHLVRLHDMIRDAPTTPKRGQTLAHAAVALIIPTVTFLVALLGEVYAERLLNRFLP